jgi:Fur family transcriptional regulator, peroxide stress response regulator
MKRLNILKVEELIQSRGLKMTPQRHAIVDYLENAENHPTAEEVFNTVNIKFPMTSRATVYNTLNWLKEAGLIQERFEGDAIKFDPNCEQHHHFVCRQCGKLEDVGFDLIDSIGICTLPGQQTIESFEITLRGLCLDCKNG